VAVKRLLLLCALASCAPAGSRLPAPAPGPEARELVVLVHGLGRSSRSMAPLGWTLEGAGYQVLNWGYSSTCCTVDELGTRLRDAVRAHPAASTGRVHFVGHSLGNVLIRHLLAQDGSIATGRVVMLAPPNQGSRAADRMSPLLGWLLQPLAELRTAAMQSAPGLAVPAAVEVGVIAGRYDGKVSVAETHLEGADAHLVVSSFHPFIMLHSDVHRQVVHFLRFGRFDPPAAPAAARAPASARSSSASRHTRAEPTRQGG
jgi:triacylglycerol lipase